MAIEVCIKLDDQGQYSVGVESAAEESMGMSPEQGGGMQGKGMQGAQGGGTMDMMKGGMQGADSEKDMSPAKNLDDALNQARQLLTAKADEGMTKARNEVAGQVWGQ